MTHIIRDSPLRNVRTTGVKLSTHATCNNIFSRLPVPGTGRGDVAFTSLLLMNPRHILATFSKSYSSLGNQPKRHTDVVCDILSRLACCHECMYDVQLDARVGRSTDVLR